MFYVYFVMHSENTYAVILFSTCGKIYLPVCLSCCYSNGLEPRRFSKWRNGLFKMVILEPKMWFQSLLILSPWKSNATPWNALANKKSQLNSLFLCLPNVGKIMWAVHVVKPQSNEDLRWWWSHFNSHYYLIKFMRVLLWTGDSR